MKHNNNTYTISYTELKVRVSHSQLDQETNRDALGQRGKRLELRSGAVAADVVDLDAVSYDLTQFV